MKLKTDIREKVITVDDVIHSLDKFQEDYNELEQFFAVSSDVDDLLYDIDNAYHVTVKLKDSSKEIFFDAILLTLIMADEYYPINKIIEVFKELKIKTGDLPVLFSTNYDNLKMDGDFFVPFSLASGIVNYNEEDCALFGMQITLPERTGLKI